MTDSIGLMVPELVSTWVSGWAVSRGTPPPLEKPWGFSSEVGDPDHGRHVLPAATEASVRRAAASVNVPHTWLKVPMEPDEVAGWLPEGWVVDKEETGHLMAVELRPTDPAPPEGYTASVETRDGVTYVQVRDAAGGPAATGQMAVLGQATVVGRVVTEEAHRRRGLGDFVMRTLADHAAAEGASLGILGATDDGRALYETLGWRRHTSLAACVCRA
ncbi:GNAT family N-acetyltransferase [Streptomyces sp. NPDC048483]|uniref:GNAT family N-acetyltransferase n=1 Tax=Streptomyces sp. NPDC048483 TaxID=3154927 RepID=UPI0034217CF8